MGRIFTVSERCDNMTAHTFRRYGNTHVRKPFSARRTYLALHNNFRFQLPALQNPE
jgi:hypothetical protein